MGISSRLHGVKHWLQLFFPDHSLKLAIHVGYVLVACSLQYLNDSSINANSADGQIPPVAIVF